MISNEIDYNFKLIISESGSFPRVIIDREFYANCIRIGFICYELTKKKLISKIKLDEIRVCINLYNNINDLKKINYFLDERIQLPENIITTNRKIEHHDFHMIINYLLAKNLIEIKNEQNLFFLILTENFSKILQNFDSNKIEKYLNERISLIIYAIQDFSINGLISQFK